MSNYIISKEIIEQFQRGDEEAFVCIYKGYYSKIYYIAYSYFNNEESAKEATQTTFLEAYKHKGKLKVPEAFHVWIYRIAYSVCRNTTRKKQPKIQVLNESTSIEEFQDMDKMDAAKIFHQTFIVDQITTSVAELSDTNRMIASMRFFDELSIQEISSILNVPEGTIKSKISRIKLELKDSLKRKGVTPTILKSTTIPILVEFFYANNYPALHVSTASAKVMYSSVLVPLSSKSIIQVATKHWLTKALFAVGTLTLVGYVAIQWPANKASISLVPQSRHFQENESTTACKIVSVDYNHQYTKEPITVNVTTTTKEYDQILLNNQSTLVAYGNGAYVVSLVKDNKVIDEVSIVIETIDNANPTLISTNRIDRTYNLVVEDYESGIDPQQTTMRTNGESSTQFQYNATTHTIVFDCKQDSNNVFEVYDYAGNKRTIEISSILD